MGTADFTIVENVLSLKEIINPKRIEHATQKARWKPEMISIDLFRECQSCVVFLHVFQIKQKRLNFPAKQQLAETHPDFKSQFPSNGEKQLATHG